MPGIVLTACCRFVPTNARTLKTKVPNVYCVGDCAEMTIPGTNEPHPKAGVFSMEQGKVVASDIIESLQVMLLVLDAIGALLTLPFPVLLARAEG